MKSVSFKSWIFTLIELLVVIAITTILMTILMPALKQTKRSVYKTDCASNLRQTGSALFMYTQDFDDWIPVGFFDEDGKAENSSANFWFGKLNSFYLGKPEIFYSCKEARNRSYKGWGGVAYGSNNRISPGLSSAKRYRQVRLPSIKYFCGDSRSIMDGSSNSYCAWLISYMEGEPNEPDWRHAGQANFLFFDGHVSSAGLAEAFTNKTSSSNGHWDP
jgi:prepilin-type processing-associated H-X9-DG protein